MHLHRSTSSFTLVELLVVIGILAILTAAVVIVLNPAELLKQSRDSKRTTDLAGVNNAIKLLLTQNPDVSLGNASTIYLSLSDSSSTCGSYSLPALPSGWKYGCSTAANYQKTDGSGWIPVNFSSTGGVASLPALPADPQNDASGRLYYAYAASNGRWVLTSLFESAKYAQKEGVDGGADPASYEVGPAASLVPFANGLVGYWNFDETSGTTSYDQSGWGNNGTTYLSTSTAGYIGTTSGCRAGGCLNLLYGRFAIMPSAPQLNFGTSGFSASVWFKIPNPSADLYGEKSLINKYTGGYDGWRYEFADKGFNAFAGHGAGVFDSTINAPPAVTDSSWHLATLVVDRAAATMRTYYDSTLLASSKIAGSSDFDTGTSLFIGKQSWSDIFFPNGLVDDVRVYSRALSAGEVQALYNAGK
jgi:type II secretory pathway pseudopilin PulG